MCSCNKYGVLNVDNHVTILYFYVTFEIIKCNEILFKQVLS